MAKITNPARFSDHFNIDELLLRKLGVLNPTLNVDTPLFIDPMLLSDSSHPEMKDGAAGTFQAHFEKVIKLLVGSKQPGDVAWRAASKLMAAPEVKGTCLGYGGNSISGSGSGRQTTDGLVDTAKQIIDLGVDDPDLFVAMGLFEDGIGPDRISDMTANVIFPDLLAFNERIYSQLTIEREMMMIKLRNGHTYEAAFPRNPFEKGDVPVILVPLDILRDLPIAVDWAGVSDAAQEVQDLRDRVNQRIADIWSKKTLKDKDELRRWALSSKSSFDTLLEIIHGSSPDPYDVANDPKGALFWAKLASTLADLEPRKIDVPKQLDLAGVSSVVSQINDQFKFLVEERRFSEELYANGKPRPEKASQMLYFAVAYSYCKANNIDLTPEADTGNGPVDFKASVGFSGRVLVEIKLSKNGKLVSGYLKQLEAYKRAEETTEAYFVVVYVGRMGKKYEELMKVRATEIAAGNKVPEVVYVDGAKRVSASKL